MKAIYFILFVLGTILPYIAFIGWISEFGFSMIKIWEGIIINDLSVFAWLDVLISAIALIIFIMLEGNKRGINHYWLAIVATCTIGVSAGLPLFLFLREKNEAVK